MRLSRVVGVGKDSDISSFVLGAWGEDKGVADVRVYRLRTEQRRSVSNDTVTAARLGSNDDESASSGEEEEEEEDEKLRVGHEYTHGEGGKKMGDVNAD